MNEEYIAKVAQEMRALLTDGVEKTATLRKILQ
jgi:hypothetical protein